MTNCRGLHGTKEVSTDKCQFKNRESPEEMGKTGLLREKLASSGERLATVLGLKNDSLKRDTPHPWHTVGQGL